MNTYDTTTFERGGRRFQLEKVYDEDHGAPWTESDGHGPVREVRAFYGLKHADVKRAGERVMHHDRGQYWLYDWAEAIRIAKRDGWDAKPYGEGTKGERAARAAQADFDYMRRWLSDQWHWMGVRVTLLDGDGEPTGDDESLWGIESDCDSYQMEVANQLADLMLERVNEAAWQREHERETQLAEQD